MEDIAVRNEAACQVAVVSECCTRLEGLVAAYHEAREEIVAGITAAVHAAICEDDRAAVDEMASLLYWGTDIDMPSLTLILNMLPREMARAAGPLDRARECRWCKDTYQYTIKSRSALKEYEKDPSFVCKPCQTERDNAWKEELRRQDEEKEEERSVEAAKKEQKAARISELASMPYRDYLQTPEWKLRRLNAIYFAGKSCQLCNAKDCILDVHHRTYVRRGDEHPSDLIVLCRDCHDKFHRESKVSPF